MEYTCTNPECGWSGDNPDESNDGEGNPVCPECEHLCDYEES